MDILESIYSQDYGYIAHDSKFACVRDQCGMGLFDGRRKTEFCQEAGHSDLSSAMKDIYGDKELGGTQVVYLSAVPFAKLGLPTNVPDFGY